MELRAAAAATVFVGREREQTALAAMLQAVAGGGSGGGALLAGDPGIGKTRTAEEAAQLAESLGIRVLWGRCYEGEGAPPFWPWIQVLRAYLREVEPARLRAEVGAAAPDLARLAPELYELLGLQPTAPAADAEQARFALFDGLTTFLYAAGRAQPLLIVLDDLHWADSASLLHLQFMARDLHSAPVVVLATYREADIVRGQPLARALTELARFPRILRMELGGLAEADVARIVEAVCGRVPPAALVAGVTRVTEGNPFFISEVVQLLNADGRIDAWFDTSAAVAQLAVPRTVREAIGRRLDLLSDRCIAILSIAAVLGRDFQLRPLAAIAATQNDPRLEGDAVLDALEEAEVRGIIAPTSTATGWYRFGHALIRETLYEELSSTRRMRLHRQAGETLERFSGGSAGSNVAEIASHFVRAAPARDALKAARYERWAGDHALSNYAYAEAAQHYNGALHVLDLAGPEIEDRDGENSVAGRCDLSLSLGKAQRMAGDTAEARKTFLASAAFARAIGDSARLAQAAQGFAGDIPQRRGGDTTLVELIDEALVALRGSDSADHAMLLARLAIELYYLPDTDRSAELGRAAFEMARRLEDARAMAYSLRFQAVSHALEPEQRLLHTDELIRLASAEQSLALEMAGRGWRAICLLMLGDATEADAEIAAYAAIAEQLRQPVHIAHEMTLRATRAGMAGQFDEAERLAEAGLAAAQSAGRADALTTYGGLSFVLRAMQGRLAELEASFRSFATQDPNMPVWRCALAYLYAEIDRADDAREQFDAVVAAGLENIPRDNLWLVALTALAECCAYLRDEGRAAQIYDLLLPFAHYNVVISGGSGCTGSVARVVGLLAAALRRWEEAERHFEAALVMNARIGATPWLATTQYNYAALLHDRDRPGDRERAAALLAEARATAGALGMATLARRGLALAEALQAPPAPAPAEPARATLPDGLSEREAEVLGLVATGLSNRAIADELVLSIRTVETHLNRAYAKIGARGRSDAIAYVFRNGLT